MGTTIGFTAPIMIKLKILSANFCGYLFVEFYPNRENKLENKVRSYLRT
jgi:hypothetical protein